MDRFIVLTYKNNNVDVICLKSNMDRFIVFITTIQINNIVV